MGNKVIIVMGMTMKIYVIGPTYPYRGGISH